MASTKTAGVTKKVKVKKKYKKQQVVSSYIMLMPTIVGFFVFSIYPILWVVRYAFCRYDGVDANTMFIGLDNFIRLFQDKNYWMSVINTFIIAIPKLVLEIPLALLLAVMLSSSKTKFKRVFSVGYYCPHMLGSVVSCLIFTFMFSSFNGVVNNALMSLGILSEPHNWFADKWSAMFVIILHSFWLGFSSNMLFFMAGIQNIPEDMYEAADLDGANKFQQFVKITVPMIAPTIRIILMLAIVNGLKAYMPVMLLTNGGPANQTNVVMLYIYQQYFETSGVIPQYGYASAMGVIVSFIVAGVTVLYLRVSRKANEVY